MQVSCGSECHKMGNDLNPVAVEETFTSFSELYSLNTTAAGMFGEFISEVVKAGEECRS